MQRETEFSGSERPTVFEKQEEREKMAEGRRGNRGGREIEREFASAASGGLKEELPHHPARKVTVELCRGS